MNNDDYSSPDETGRQNDGANDYVVGYARPPKSTWFKPGHSGNPKGRPKQKCPKFDLLEVLTAKVPITVGGRRCYVTRIHALVLMQWERACKGSERATKEIIALAKLLGAFDPPDPVPDPDENYLSDADFESLSEVAQLELIQLAERNERRRMQ